MFKTIELGAWYRIRLEGRSVFGEILERHGKSYTARYLSEEGKTSEAEVARSNIMGRLGEAFVDSLTHDAGIASESEVPVDSPPPIALGDWHRFEHQGKTVAGVVYRVEGNRYTVFFLDNGERRFVTLDRGQVGPREERLTRLFRSEMTKTPNYLEDWVSKAGKFADVPIASRPPQQKPRKGKAGREGRERQKQLFSE